MDPDETLTTYERAVRDGDVEGAKIALDDLHEWRRKGGFPPRQGWPRGA